MNGIVEECCSCWQQGKCRLSSELIGWGCKLLVCLPEYVPETEHDKARLFSKVYNYAQRIGVLQCPHYDELTIDRTLINDKMLREMVLLNQPLRADLLSEELELLRN